MVAFVQAAHFYSGRRRPLRVIVVHDMEMPEQVTTAESCARYFATTDRSASAHVCIDSDSAVDCVRLEDTAWAAPGANADGFQIELAGYARQTREEWLDPFSSATLRMAALYVATKPGLEVVPSQWLSDAQLADGSTKGFTTHAQVTRVFRLSTHTDPGPAFPADIFMQYVISARGGSLPTAPPVPTPAPAHAPAPPPSYPPCPGITREGMRNSPVTAAYQKRLRDRGWRISVDGDHGPATTATLRAFQREKGLSPDGVGGPQTWRALWTAPVTR